LTLSVVEWENGGGWALQCTAFKPITNGLKRLDAARVTIFLNLFCKGQYSQWSLMLDTLNVPKDIGLNNFCC